MSTQTIAPTDRRDPFSRLGTDVSSATNVTEALAAAGLDWGIREIDADQFIAHTPDGPVITGFPGRRFITRDDTNATLGVVGSTYRSAPNADWFAVADSIAALGGKFEYAGERDGGQRTFLTMSLPEATVEVGGYDVVNFRVVLTAAHDGRNNNTAAVRGTRLWCTNGCTVTIKGVSDAWKIKHTPSGVAQMTEATKIVQGLVRYAKEFAAVAEHLVSVKMTNAQFTKFIDELSPRPDEDAGPKALTRWENRRAELVQLFKFASTNDFGRDTAYGAWNATTEWADWQSSVAARGSTDRNLVRAMRQADNTQQNLRTRALELLLPA